MDSTSSSLTLRLTEHCPVCGGPLHEGPLGPRCPRCVFALSVEVDDLDEAAVAQLFPELEIEGKIARGGFGTVFRAQHRRLKRAVALKFLDPGLTHSPEAIARFELEMESVGRLDHAGIVRAYDAGEREGRWFIVMEHVDGEDLATLSRREGPLEPVKACRLIHEAARSLAYAHERGLVHRDVKPSNIMLTHEGGAVKVLDFGLAVTVDATLSDYFSGTPDYAAPEQITTPREVDARADVFGLGATLFRLLTGQAPHVVGGEVSMTERMARISREPPPPVQTLRKDLPAGLPALVDRLLAMDRTKRPQSAAEVAGLLTPFAGLSEKKSTKWPLVAAVAVLGLGAAFWPADEKGVEPAPKPVLAPKPAPEPPGSLAELKQKSSVIPAVFKSAKDVPVTGVTCDVSGLQLDLKLEFAPEPGMKLTALRNTGHAFIQGEFTNVKNGQQIELEHAGKKYPFTAWYYGGNGNDLVLLWPYTGLAAWGYSGGGAGTLGDGRNQDSNVPVEVDMKGVLRGKTVVALAAGLQHTLALSNDGKLYAWGNNMFGQLGDGSTNTSPRPLEVRLTGALAGKKVVSMAAGGRFSLALCADGTVAAWGANDIGQLGAGSEKTLSREPLAVDTSGVLKGRVITQVRAGLEFAVALSSEGKIFAWGQNRHGALGTGVSGLPSRVPVAVPMGQAAGRRITELCAAPSGGHALALSDEGKVYAWGLNNSGQAGSQRAGGNLINGLMLLHGPLTDGAVVGMAGGGTHSVFLLRDGRVVTLGGNQQGQLGIDTRLDSQLPLLVDTSGVLSGKRIQQVAAGSNFSAAFSEDGQIFTWGSNATGRLGNRSQEKDSLVAVLVNREPGVSALAGRRVCDAGLHANGNGCTVIYTAQPGEPQALVAQAPPPVSAGNSGTKPVMTGQSQQITPRFQSAEWEIESVIETVKPQRAAQFMRDGSLISVAERDAPAPQVTRWVRGAGGWVAEVLDLGPARKRSWRAFVHPKSGHFVLTEPAWNAPDRLVRRTPEGKEMPDLLYSDKRYSSLEAVAFVRAGAMPPGAALREGDILVADAGSGPWAGKGSLWRARLDNDEPLELLVEDELLSAPVDVTVNSRGVYLFNRNKGYLTSAAASDEDLSSRVIRWDGSRLIRCQLSEPVRDPSALVAAPDSSGVLYAAEGSSGPMSHASQRVLKLTPGREPDSFSVTEIATHFGKLYGGALAIHPDGTLLAVTDHEKKRIYLQRRRL